MAPAATAGHRNGYAVRLASVAGLHPRRAAAARWAMLVADWHLVSGATMKVGSIPKPDTRPWDAATVLFCRPVLLATAQTIRVSAGTFCRRCSASAIGFGVAALVGIPLGFILGRSAF
jgi:nitrate/nitrite transport system permease protein